MKKIFFTAAVLAAICIGFTGCAQPNSPNPGNGVGGGNTPTVPSANQSDLYGSYWGTLSFGGAPDLPLCIVIKADSVVLHSNIMGFTYPLVTYKDEGNGTWTINCYHAGADTTNPDKVRVRVVVDTKTSPFSCKATIVPMNATTKPCIKGKDYNGEYAK